MSGDVIRCLMCPHCGEGLALVSESVRCASGHSFDVARQGYVNLLAGDARTGTADTAGMVAARESFLGAGHYEPLAEEVGAMAERMIGRGNPGCVIEIGAGTGYYLAAVVARLPGAPGLALDISKHAARRAARAHERVFSAVCDAWRALPVRTGVAALVLDVFAPRNAEEFARVLEPGGALIVVTPEADHLAEIVGTLGMLSVAGDKEVRVQQQLGDHFEEVEAVHVKREMRLGHADIRALVGMGPSAYHADPEQLERRIGDLVEPTPVTLSVRVTGYRSTASDRPLADRP